jgi:hypothetical protein
MGMSAYEERLRLHRLAPDRITPPMCDNCFFWTSDWNPHVTGEKLVQGECTNKLNALDGVLRAQYGMYQRALRPN